MEIGLPMLSGSDSPVSSRAGTPGGSFSNRRVGTSGSFNSRRRNSVDGLDCHVAGSVMAVPARFTSASFNSKVPASFSAKRRNSVDVLVCGMGGADSSDCRRNSTNETDCSGPTSVVGIEGLVDFDLEQDSAIYFSNWAPEPLPRKLPYFPAPPPKLHYTTRW
eukprot:CAMPEP_0113662154 /NCGR_PEP_ID=MMETSP0038_2-20120614/404_1 /TAXON_ID=2898 /ORGANISM="Cryptomonas paramecium" /LENGTH=162 /DNA_ID=CAMNT_0000576989 /DNA_START=178 /DNA_END=663 /DNA_ORIENTATION=+ /assembly_acc=CAM_ASM_000170